MVSFPLVVADSRIVKGKPVPVVSTGCSICGPTVPRVDEDRFETAAQAAEWDARYSEGDGEMWSGRPNGRLVAEVDGLTPGASLDVGCGEGADAIWMARQGWAVTAIDISD